jgi:cytochrome c-type biogenesis protein CcmH
MNTLISVVKLLLTLYRLFSGKPAAKRKEIARRRANLGASLVSAVIRLILLLGSLTSLLFIDLVFAQSGEPTDDQVNAIASQLYCPVCENTPLDVCPTHACAQWRATIKEKLAAGWSEQEIKDYFVEQYGERVLAQPSSRGLNVFIWILPPVVLLVGVFFLVRYLRAARRSKPITASTPPAADDDYTQQLEKELAKRR